MLIAPQVRAIPLRTMQSSRDRSRIVDGARFLSAHPEGRRQGGAGAATHDNRRGEMRRLPISNQ
jgi:hypothetical protein